MSGTRAKGGKKNRKHGRNKDRKPAMARYRGEDRGTINKRKRAEREEKRLAKDAAKKEAQSG